MELLSTGLDLRWPFDAGASGLPELGAGRGVLIGNTRALWAPFVAAYRADATLRADPDPLDRYVERAIAAAAPPGARVFFGHRPDDAGRFLPIQRLAAAVGLGALSPTHLVIHPTFGPWIALRAVIVTDQPPPPPAPPIAPCRCAAECMSAFDRACAATGDDAWRAWLAVRDACPVGKEARYGEAQLRYHYTKDRAVID